MTSRTAVNGNRFFVLFAVLALVITLPAMALDITFNGRNLEVMDTEALAAFAVSPPDADPVVLPLSALFPWLESVEYVEAQSGANRIFWDASELGDSAWYDAVLQRRGGVWEVRIGRDVFSAPDRIAVQGVELDIEEITIWSSVDDPVLKSSVESVLAFRDVPLTWRQLTDPAYLLSDPPSSGLPHLVLTGPLGRGTLDEYLTSWRSVASGSYAWYGEVPADPAAVLSETIAANAYHPETALFHIALTGGRLFDESGLAADMEEYLTWAADSRKEGRLIVTEKPVEAVRSGEVALALLIPSGKQEISASDNLVPIRLPGSPLANYLAVPAGLDDAGADVAGLLLEAMDPYLNEPGSADREPDSRFPAFYAAYERIGRLVISGQMSPAEGIALMNEYIAARPDERSADG